MPLSSSDPSRPSDGTTPVVQLSQGLAIAIVAAALGYVLHHVPFLEDHAMLGAALSLAVAGLAAVAIGAIAVPVRRRVLPVVLLAPGIDSPIRPLERRDVEFCVALHREALGHGFFVELGDRFMRAYYGALLDSPHAVALKVEVGGQAVGLLVGALRARVHRSWMIRHRGALLVVLGSAGLIGHPRAAFRFARTRLRRYARTWRRQRLDEPEEQLAIGADPAVLTHVAVVPGARRSGAGRRLVEAFTDQALHAGAHRALLTTLADEGAGSFYERLGWRRSGTHTTADGREVEEWVRELQGIETS